MVMSARDKKFKMLMVLSDRCNALTVVQTMASLEPRPHPKVAAIGDPS